MYKGTKLHPQWKRSCTLIIETYPVALYHKGIKSA